MTISARHVFASDVADASHQRKCYISLHSAIQSFKIYTFKTPLTAGCIRVKARAHICKHEMASTVVTPSVVLLLSVLYIYMGRQTDR